MYDIEEMMIHYHYKNQKMLLIMTCYLGKVFHATYENCKIRREGNQELNLRPC